MYAESIAQQSARNEARGMQGQWEHLAFRVAQDEAERGRAIEMAHLWRMTAMELDNRIKHGKRFVAVADLFRKVKYVADALVVSKSELAYRIDHG